MRLLSNAELMHLESKSRGWTIARKKPPICVLITLAWSILLESKLLA